MYKTCIALVLVATVCAQEYGLEDIDSWIEQMFGKTGLVQNRNLTVDNNHQVRNLTVDNNHQVRNHTVDNKHQASTTVLPVNLNPSYRKNDKCTMQTGEPGVCVRYYLCNDNNNVITDGTGIFDLRERPACPSYLETCCRISNTNQPDILSTHKPYVPPQREGCGWINPEGIGLKTTDDGKAKFGEIPWMVAILIMKPNNETDPSGPKSNFYVGGGSLIHPKAVLTAANNAYQSYALKVRAGEWDTQTTNEIYPHQDRYVSHIEVHKDYNKNNLFYDIAVLFLASAMDSAPNVGWACLPPPQEETPPGTRCIISGWGKDKLGTKGHYQAILKKVEVPVVEKRQCQQQLRQTDLGPVFILHDSFMCAGGETGKGTCTGDEGSPLVCPIEGEPGRYYLSGIVAWGTDCGETGNPDVYVDVGIFGGWINDKITRQGLDTKYYFL